ncbi:hypothetical protein CALCODRAFT_136616 [Calocera cornea HHB12733]|uniref:Uncharacterized protein n=1 Tax=Calocera cornea HHB12733 TaxID=1353952 RepID=A0A165CU38_9BASI|nr:hypothetical protein CALCODRAFT_136616 [Calocera cornea HHB12733]
MASVDDEADLYADLYGAEDNEDAPAPDASIEQAPEAVKVVESASADLPGLPTMPAAPASSTTPSTGATASFTSAPTSAPTGTATSASPAPQPRVEPPLNTQPIMTYSSDTEQPKQTRFSGPPGGGFGDSVPAAFPHFNKSFEDGNQQQAPRSGFQSNVRPSEMPDEGLVLFHPSRQGGSGSRRLFGCGDGRGAVTMIRSSFRPVLSSHSLDMCTLALVRRSMPSRYVIHLPCLITVDYMLTNSRVSSILSNLVNYWPIVTLCSLAHGLPLSGRCSLVG